MDWGKAKNYTIIFLIILNLFLLLCNLWFNKRYVLTESQIESIKSILSTRGIELDSEIPVEYKPMIQINLENCVYDTDYLQKIFFDGKDDIKRTSEFEKTILTADDEKVTIFSDYVEFEKEKADFSNGFNEDEVLKFCRGYIDRIGDFYEGFELRCVEKRGTAVVIEYNQLYRGYDIFNNFVIINAEQNGKISIKLKYFPIKNMYGNAVDICSADEALFIFSDKAKEACNSDKINITNVEKGYYFDDFEKDDSVVSVPYYRIEVAQRDTPFFVNAYNRTLSEG